MNNYNCSINEVINKSFINWEKLKGKTILLSGATGMIGSCLIDIIETRNKKFNDNIKIIAIGRNKEKAQKRIRLEERSDFLKFVLTDVNIEFSVEEHVDYVIHAASNTHPMQYATEPVNTIKTNVFGLDNMLKIARNKNARFMFLSSVEVYGKNRGDTDEFTEDYCGYIDSNTLRAGYPESKRLGETLCQAYKSQYGLDIVISRLSRIYGFTMQEEDSKVIAQFIKNAVNKENIILKSDGMQKFGYVNVVDAVTGILIVMLSGKTGEAYNIEDTNSRVILKDLAYNIARIAGVNVEFRIPSELEKNGYSTANTALMSNYKIRELGWSAQIDIDKGIKMLLEDLEKGGE